MNCWKYAWFFPTLSDNSDNESPSCATRETIALRAVSIGAPYIIFHRRITGFSSCINIGSYLPIKDRQAIRCCADPSSAAGSPALIHGSLLWRYRGESIWRSAGTKDHHVFVKRFGFDRPFILDAKGVGLRRKAHQYPALKRRGRARLIEQDDSREPTLSLRKDDPAFQRAMRHGNSTSTAGRLATIRVPNSSGCSSPALECAGLVAQPH